jgi:hypothetical protein
MLPHLILKHLIDTMKWTNKTKKEHAKDRPPKHHHQLYVVGGD